MRRIRVAAMIGVVAVSAALLSGCVPSASADDDIVTVNGFESQYPLVPAFAHDAGGYRILNQLFAGLVFYSESGTAVNDLAESMVPNADNTVWTISIHDDSLFSDGEPVTAKSFADAWDWAALASHAAVNRSYFSDIVGYSADTDVSLIEAGGLVVIDDSTLEVHLKSPLSDFPQRLGHITFAPLPSAFYRDPDAFGEHPIGNGPYIFDGDGAWQHGERLELIANPAYEGPREPANKGVTMRFYDTIDLAYSDLLSGNLDVLDTLPASALGSFQDEVSGRYVDHPLAVLESLAIPSTIPHFKGPEGAFRRAAISRAIDREAIIADLFGVTRTPAEDFTSPALDGWSDTLTGSEVLGYNEDTALELWAEAEKLSPWEGTLEIAYNADGDHAAWVEAAAESISSVLKIEVVPVEHPSLADLQEAIESGTMATAFRSSARADYPGALAFLRSTFGSKGGANLTKYVSAPFDAALRRSMTAKSPTDAADALEDAQQILFTDLPVIPLWNIATQGGYGESVDDVAFDWQGVPLYHLVTKRDG